MHSAESSAESSMEEGVPGDGPRCAPALVRTLSPRAARALEQAGAEARKKGEVLKETAAHEEAVQHLQRDIDAVQREIETATPRSGAVLGQTQLQTALRVEAALEQRISAMVQQLAEAETELQAAQQRTALLRQLMQSKRAAPLSGRIPSEHEADGIAVGDPDLCSAEAPAHDQDQDQDQERDQDQDQDQDQEQVIHEHEDGAGQEQEEQEEQEDVNKGVPLPGRDARGGLREAEKMAREDSSTDSVSDVSSSSSGSGDSSSDDDDSADSDDDSNGSDNGAEDNTSPPPAQYFNVGLEGRGGSTVVTRVRMEISTRGLGVARRGGGSSNTMQEIFCYSWPQVSNWTPLPSKGIKFAITGIAAYTFRTKRGSDIIEAVMQQINYVLALQQADPAREARQHSVRQLTALGVHQTDAVEALKAAGGDFRQAAQALDFDLQVASRFVRAPIGLPNRSNDCFWLATVQCLRHVPGFAQTVTACTERALQRPPLNVAHALANLLLRMERQREADYLSLRCPELHDFIRICERNLPKDDGHALVQSNFQRQEQEDSNEFLNQLLNVLGEYAFQGGQDTGDPGPPPSRSASSLAVQEHARLRLLAIAEELTEASKEEDWGEVYKLVSEFADIQWDGSRLRLRSGIGELLEGQRLVVMECSACRRWSAGSADSFIMEEVRVQPKGARRGGGSGKVHNSLTSMLRGNTARDTPEGYRCDGCGAADTTAFRDGLRKLPKVYAVHINRTLPNGSRCSEPVQLEETLDLKDMLLYKQKGPIDHSNQPCASSYQLAAVTFHRGVSARSGHYIACVRDMSLGKSPTYRVAKPLKVTVDIAPSSAEVMQLEPGSSLVCLEEREHVGSGIVRRSTTRMLCQYGWVTPSAGSLARTSGWTELDDDEVSECGPGVTPQAIERSRAGARAAMLFYVRDELEPPEPDPGDAVGSPD